MGTDMVEHDGLMRVFWPTDIEQTDVPGVIVGWRNSGLDVVVIAVLQHVEVRTGTSLCLTIVLITFRSHEMSTMPCRRVSSSEAPLSLPVEYSRFAASRHCTCLVSLTGRRKPPSSWIHHGFSPRRRHTTGFLTSRVRKHPAFRQFFSTDPTRTVCSTCR